MHLGLQFPALPQSGGAVVQHEPVAEWAAAAGAAVVSRDAPVAWVITGIDQRNAFRAETNPARM